MIPLLNGWHRMKQAGVLGLNARNGDYIMRFNNRRNYPLVDDKVRCKTVLEANDLPAPALIGVIRRTGDSNRLKRFIGEQESFVIKPSNGSGGDGILVIESRRNGRYRSVSGRLYDEDELAHHLTNVISGLYSLGGQPDHAMLEALVQFDPVFEQIAFQGVPDIRVIVYRGVPVMAMVRLPTRASQGKANLHQGAIGAGVALSSGHTTGGVVGNHRVSEHSDTGASIVNFPIPHWKRIVQMSALCSDAVGLGYLGVDLVIDHDRGPLVLELNARPGLNIQIANGTGLARRLRLVDEDGIHTAPARERAAWAREHFVL